MNKKIFFIGVVAFFLTTAAISSARLINNQKQVLNNENREFYLGRASIFGDGLEENTSIELIAENDLTIGISAQTEIVSFYIDYTMNCTGLTDSGAISLLIQINGDNKGNNETLTLTNKTGKLVVEEIEVKRQDILSFEITGVYTNLNPAFVVSDVTIGGGIINHPLKTLKSLKMFTIIESILIKNFISLQI